VRAAPARDSAGYDGSDAIVGSCIAVALGMAVVVAVSCWYARAKTRRLRVLTAKLPPTQQQPAPGVAAVKLAPPQVSAQSGSVTPIARASMNPLRAASTPSVIEAAPAVVVQAHPFNTDSGSRAAFAAQPAKSAAPRRK